MSFLKQLPPKPGPEFKNSPPILRSNPTAFDTSLISAPVSSQMAVIEFIELILCAKKAFEVSLASSLLHKFVLMIAV